MKISCGIIILNEYDEIFMAHSTGNKFFDIPKGMLEEKEDPVMCAIRECKEETSLIVSNNNLTDLGEHAYNKEKKLHLFVTFISKKNIILEDLKCESYFEDFYTKKMRPEADYFEWKKVEEAHLYCAKSMGKLLSQLREDGKLNFKSYMKNDIEKVKKIL